MRRPLLAAAIAVLGLQVGASAMTYSFVVPGLGCTVHVSSVDIIVHPGPPGIGGYSLYGPLVDAGADHDCTAQLLGCTTFVTAPHVSVPRGTDPAAVSVSSPAVHDECPAAVTPSSKEIS